MVLLEGEKIMTLAFFVLAQYQTDGQNDGQTRCDRCYLRSRGVKRPFDV